MAPYLKRQCRFQLRKGRRFKTMLRASAWRPDENESRDQCPRCCNGVNSISHLLFHCSAIDAEVRKEFLDKMRTLIPNFDTLNMEEQVDLFLAPDAPQEWDRTLYKFLGRVSDSL